MSEQVGPAHPPDPATLRWMAAMMQREVEKLGEQYHLLAAGTDRVMAQGAYNALTTIRDMCIKTAAAAEAESAPATELPEGVVT